MTQRPELGDLVAVPTRAPRLPASDVEGWDLTGSRRTLRLESQGHWTLLLFLGSKCDGCLPFWTVPRAPTACGLDPQDEVVVVTREPDEEEPEALAALMGAPVGGGPDADGTEVLLMSAAAWRTYRVHGPPFFVLLDGVVVATEGVAWSVEQVAADVARARQPAGEAARRPHVQR